MKYECETLGGSTLSFEDLLNQALTWAKNNPEKAKYLPTGYIYNDEGYYMDIFYQIKGE